MNFIEIYFCANILLSFIFIIYCFREREHFYVVFFGTMIMVLFGGVIAIYGVFKRIWEALM